MGQNRQMKILVLSDLHNDISPMAVLKGERRIDEGVDVVVLAGDIHEGVQAQIWAREAFPEKEIVQIAGNHEFYGRFWKRNLRKMKEKAQELGIHFLENESVVIADVRFLGCTLWTDYALYGRDNQVEMMRHAAAKMTDHIRIKLDRKPGENQDFRETGKPMLQPSLVKRRHEQSLQWLIDELQNCDFDKTVVITHHAPSDLSIPEEFKGHPLSPAYASDLSGLMGKAKLWIHGHIHASQDYMLGGTRIVCNPRGYPVMGGGMKLLKNQNDSFDPAFCVEI